MKTIVEALQDLYVALGGKESDVSGLKLNPDVIEQIAALVDGGALNELPAVTGADAGDVLTVSAEGKWEAAAPGGGGDDFNFVTVTNNNNTLSSDISAEKVFQDLQAGKRYGVKYKNAPSENPVFIGELLVSTVSTNTQVRASVINLDGGVGNNGPGSIAIRAIWIRYYNSAYSWSKSYGVAQIATTVPGT